MGRLYAGNYRESSPFGTRVLANGESTHHNGIDYVGIDSKMVIAPTNGLIVTSQIITDRDNLTWEWGNYVKMDDFNGYFLFFCHLSRRLVRPGQVVNKGQEIGIEGATGYAFGSHLHFEVRRKVDNVVINPEEYFKVLEDWEKSQVDNLKKVVQQKTGFDDNTINYLSQHPYPYDLFNKLVMAME